MRETTQPSGTSRLIAKALSVRSIAILAALLGVALVGASVVAGTSWPSTEWLERASLLGQILGLIVASVAAVLIWLQITDIRQTLRRDDFDSTSQRILRMSELQLQYRSEYAQLLRGRVTMRSRNLAEALLDVMDTEVLRRKTMSDLQGPSVPPLEDYFADLLTEVPGLAQVLEERSTWYSKDLTALVTLRGVQQKASCTRFARTHRRSRADSSA